MTEESTEKWAVSQFNQRLAMGNRITFVLRMYALVGVMMSVVAIGYLAYSKLGLNFSSEERAAFAIALAGALMAIVSFSATSYRRARMERDIERYHQFRAVTRFLEAWSQLEETSKNAVWSDDPANKPRSIRDTIARLRTEGKITTSEGIELEELLRIRNALVHRTKQFPLDHLTDALDRLVNILTKIV